MKLLLTALAFASSFGITLGAVALYKKVLEQQLANPSTSAIITPSDETSRHREASPTPSPSDISGSSPVPSPRLPVVTDSPILRPDPSTHVQVHLLPRDLEDWMDLISYRPPIHVQEETLKYRSWKLVSAWDNAYENWYVQRIEDASGPTNLDFYGVLVKKLPTINGVQQTPETLLIHFRQNINSYIDNSLENGYTYFEPYNSSWKQRCVAESPSEAVGCYFYIKIDLPLALSKYTNIVDDATVVISKITSQYWIFSTVYAVGHRDTRPGDRDFFRLESGSRKHPVSGNRQFGFRVIPNQGYVFFTRGVDRVSDPKRALPNDLVDRIGLGAFSGSDNLWRSFQRRFTQFVNANGGEAQSLPPVQKKESWETLKMKYHHPSVPWIDNLAEGQRYPYAEPSN